jgi:hypothetical protein
MDDKKDKPGYRLPPKARQFGAPGGNPINRKGRPKGRKNEKTAFKAFMDQTLPGNKEVSTREALWMTLRQQALVEKDARAIKSLLDMDMRLCAEVYSSSASGAMTKKIADLEHELAEAKALASHTGVLVVPADVPLDEYIVQAEKQRQKMLQEKEEIARLNGL